MTESSEELWAGNEQKYGSVHGTGVLGALRGIDRVVIRGWILKFDRDRGAGDRGFEGRGGALMVVVMPIRFSI